MTRQKKQPLSRVQKRRQARQRIDETYAAERRWVQYENQKLNTASYELARLGGSKQVQFHLFCISHQYQQPSMEELLQFYESNQWWEWAMIYLVKSLPMSEHHKCFEKYVRLGWRTIPRYITVWLNISPDFWHVIYGKKHNIRKVAHRLDVYNRIVDRERLRAKTFCLCMLRHEKEKDMLLDPDVVNYIAKLICARKKYAHWIDYLQDPDAPKEILFRKENGNAV